MVKCICPKWPGLSKSVLDSDTQYPAVVQLLDTYPYRGQQYVYDLIFNLKAFRSIVVPRVYQQPKAHLDPSHWKAKDVRPFVRTRWAKGILNRFAPQLAETLYLRHIAHQVRTVHAELVHVHYGVFATQILKIRETIQLPIVASLYGSAWRAKDRVWQERYQRLFDICHVIIVECDATAQTALQAGCPPRKLRVLHLGIDVEHEFRFNPREFDGTTRFLAVARFIEKKGLPYLLDAFAGLARHEGQVQLTLVGYGELQGWIAERTSELGIADLVDIVDTTNVPDFTRVLLDSLSTHDVFVYPAIIDSRGDHEGTPICLIAAQAAGLPVIGTDIGGIEEVIRKGGVLISPRNVTDLEQQMSVLANDLGRRQILGLAGRDYVSHEFSLSTQVAELETLYAEVLKDRASNQ